MPFQPTLPARGATSCDAHEGGEEHFNPRSPHGERRLLSLLPRPSCEKFQPTLPARGATAGSKSVFYALLYFNPRSPHGERRSGTRREKSRARFQPTLPARGATLGGVQYSRENVFQPTLPARGATVPASSAVSTTNYFNPRSPHGERPSGWLTWMVAMANFNPRSPHGERRPSLCTAFRAADFNPRSPHGERQLLQGKGYQLLIFQPTLPARGATKGRKRPRKRRKFQPTLPARGATNTVEWWEACCKISTHAPRTGSDPTPGLTDAGKGHFNPRSPHGERLQRGEVRPVTGQFQPTLPARGATASARRQVPLA